MVRYGKGSGFFRMIATARTSRGAAGFLQMFRIMLALLHASAAHAARAVRLRLGARHDDPALHALDRRHAALRAQSVRLHGHAECLDRVGLDGRAGVPAGSLSHGEKRQLELAIALATRPKVLLLDEPLAGAGHEDARRVVETLRRLKDSLTIVLVEHDMDAVFSLADRVSVLVYGQVIATDLPERVRAHPEVRAAYLGLRSRPDAVRPQPSTMARPRFSSTSPSTWPPARS